MGVTSTDPITREFSDEEIVAEGSFGIDEFCAWADLGRTFVFAEIANQKIRTLKAGRRRLIPRLEAQRYLRERLEPSA